MQALKFIYFLFFKLIVLYNSIMFCADIGRCTYFLSSNKYIYSENRRNFSIGYGESKTLIKQKFILAGGGATPL